MQYYLRKQQHLNVYHQIFIFLFALLFNAFIKLLLFFPCFLKHMRYYYRKQQFQNEHQYQVFIFLNLILNNKNLRLLHNCLNHIKYLKQILKRTKYHLILKVQELFIGQKELFCDILLLILIFPYFSMYTLLLF